MASGKTYTVQFRRRRKGLTNYKKRLALLKGGITRLVIRRSNRYMQLQLVNYESAGDRVLTTVSSSKLVEFGWKFSKNSVPACYLTGLLLAKKAIALGVKEAIVDFGFLRSIKGGRLYAAIKGAIDGGLNVHCDEGVFPSDERITGAHIVAHAGAHKDQFTGYAKVGVDAAKITTAFDAAKSKIMGN